MSSTSGIGAVVTYDAATNKGKVQQLIDAIANPDSTSSSGAQAGGGYLDEMSPAAAVQLRVDLAALKTAIVDAA